MFSEFGTSKGRRCDGRSRLDAGLYERGAGTSSARAYARELFFQEIADRTPHVLEDLRKNVLVSYFKLRRRYGAQRVLPLLASERARQRPDVIPIEKGLGHWMHRWHLEDDWIRERALLTTEHWCRYPPTRRLTWGVGVTRLAPPAVTSDERELAFRHPGWNPGTQARGQAEQQMRALFEEQLREHFARMAAYASARGWKPAPRKRQFEHFHWLVRFQVLEENYARICGVPADAQGARTVQAGVESLADFIGLRLRPARRGRPRGSRDTKSHRRVVRRPRPTS